MLRYILGLCAAHICEEKCILAKGLTNVSHRLSQVLVAHDAASPLTQSDNTRRRREAAAFIEETTGVCVPAGADNAFRAALRDGVLLCRLINSIWPQAIEQVHSNPAQHCASSQQQCHAVAHLAADTCKAWPLCTSRSVQSGMAARVWLRPKSVHARCGMPGIMLTVSWSSDVLS